MKIHHIIIAILAVSVIILGSISFLTDLSTNYNETVDVTVLNKTLDRMETATANSQELAEDIIDFNLESVTDFVLIPYKLYKVAVGVVKQMFGSWSIIGAMISDVSKGLNENGITIDSKYTAAIIAMFIMTVVAIMLYGLYKWKFED